MAERRAVNMVANTVEAWPGVARHGRARRGIMYPEQRSGNVKTHAVTLGGSW